MRVFVAACAIAALLGSYGADANLGQIRMREIGGDEALLVQHPDTLRGDFSALALAADANIRPRRRPRAVSAAAGDSASGNPVGGVGVRTRIETCQGIAVTITSFGGGGWDQDIDSVCDESAAADGAPERSENP